MAIRQTWLEYDVRQRKHASILANRLNAIYDTMCREAAKIGLGTGFDDPEKEFYLKDFPQASSKVDALLAKMSESIAGLIRQGTEESWSLSWAKNAAMLDKLTSYFGLPKERVQGWSHRNVAALEAFQQRKVNGMGLSERVWDFVKHDKAQLEMALELGLAEGKSAAALSRDVRQYLAEPDKLFRRVRDKDGNLRLSKAAQAYHPGQGVYRSSYKNALRMTITETNMAYKSADHDQWSGIPFVIGQTVKLSNNHTCKGVKGVFFDICDELQGDYPKDFKFVGWHPHCRCYVIAKLPDREEMRKWSIMTDEEQAAYHFKGEVTEPPKNFHDWMEKNADRIENAKSVPYFIKDNPKYARGNRLTDEQRRQITLEKAKQRHEERTAEQIQDIKDRWALRQDEMQYSPEQRAMFREIEEKLGIKRGFSMPYLRADKQHANPNWGKGKQFGINCQTCAPAYQLREWGFDVYAKGNESGNLSEYLSYHWNEIWKDSKGQHGRVQTFHDWMAKKGYKNMSEKRYKEFFDDLCSEDGVYEIALSWKGDKSRHCTVLKREKGVIRYIEPQVDNNPQGRRYRDNYDELCRSMSAKPFNSILPKQVMHDGVIRMDIEIMDIDKFAPIFGTNKAIPLHTQRVLNEAALRQEARTKEDVKRIKREWQERKTRRAFMQNIASKNTAEELRSYWDAAKMLDAYKNDEALRRAFIDRAAEIRHASRDAGKIQQEFAAYQKRIELQRRTAENIMKVAKDYPYVDGSKLSDLLAKNRTADLVAETQRIAKEISGIKRQERIMKPLIPNVRDLLNTYSLKEVQGAYVELDGVMYKWLKKYNYSSIDAAPLQHLKNKLEFELTSPTFKYANKTLIDKAIHEKIALINKKIQWNGLLDKVSVLKSFKTQSKIYNKYLSEINDAIDKEDLNALRKIILKAESKQQELLNKQFKNGGGTALNKEYKGGAVGKDITSQVDVRQMVSEDPYRGTFTNNVARMQGFDAPAKLVSQAEFDILEKNCQEVFYRTVNPTTFKGVQMTSQEFASQLYVADLLELNGPGGRVYGDGMYVAVSAWDGSRLNTLTSSRKNQAYRASVCYGNGNHTISEMTFTRKPKIIKETELDALWQKLDRATKIKFGDDGRNTYACALGYDAMYTTRDYMVIWNRSIIAVKKQ